MKISKDDFLKMQEKYDKEVKKGKPAKDKKNKDIDNQTNWVFFDKKTLQDILDKADDVKGGIKFYMTEYTDATAKEMHPENPDEYVGRLTLVLSPTTMEASVGIGDPEEEYYNNGGMCPPSCEM